MTEWFTVRHLLGLETPDSTPPEKQRERRLVVAKFVTESPTVQHGKAS